MLGCSGSRYHPLPNDRAETNRPARFVGRVARSTIRPIAAPPLRTPASRLFTDIVIKCSMKSRVPRHNILRERADAQGARTIATLLRYDENNVQGHFHFLFFLPLPALGSRKNPRGIIVSRSGIIRRRRRVKKLSRRCPRRKCLV